MIYLLLLSLVMLADSIRRYFLDGDEIPVTLAILGCLITYRGWLLDQGLVNPVIFFYGIDFVFDRKSILFAAGTILAGMILLLAGYYVSKGRTRNLVRIDDSRIFRAFLKDHVGAFWVFVFMFFVASLVSHFLMQGSVGRQGAVTSNYAMLFGMGTSSCIIGLAVFGDTLHRYSYVRFLYYGVATLLALTTFNPSLRYQTLGWALFLIVYFARRFRPASRTVIYVFAGVVLATGFTVLGNLRHQESKIQSNREMLEGGRKDFFDAKDVNFVDGMVMVNQVYPKHLNYAYGMEHLEVLLRPIPRSIWPNKPKGGWVQKWADKKNSDQFNTGISPSLFGSFYAEGGFIAVAFLSVLYGWGLGALFKWSSRFGSALRTIFKAIIIGSIFAVIRGGDLAGTVAFLGMSFWPIGLFMYYYYRSIHSLSQVEYTQRSAHSSRKATTRREG